MRTLKQITDAVRRNEGAIYAELFYAVVAYDVLLAQMNIAADQQQVAEFFKAAELPPHEYVGWDNSPDNPESVEWHRTHINNRPEVFERAREMLGDDPLTVVMPGSIASVQIEGRVVFDTDEADYYEHETEVAANVNRLNTGILEMLDDDDPFGTREPIVPTGPHCPKCGKQEAAGNYSLELMSPEQQAVAPLWECMSCHHAWGHGVGVDPPVNPSPAVAELIKAAEGLDSAWISAAEDGSTTAADLEEWAARSKAAWVAVATHGDEPTPGQLPVTICITCTRIHTGDDCPFCADKMPYLDEVPFVVPCYADRDGDCNHEGCPQLRDGEPLKTGRHCPLDTGDRR